MLLWIHRHISFLLLYAMLPALVSARKAYCDRSANWHFFEQADGLAEPWSSFITVGPSGRVWVSHGGTTRLSCISGIPDSEGRYVTTLPSPGDDLKVYESPSGRLWSLYSNGIQYYQDGEWVRHPVDEIVNPNPPDRMVRELIPFLPLGNDSLLYLLPDCLMLFDALEHSRSLVLSADSTRIGQFLDIASSRDGGAWITAEHGALRIAPTRGGKVKVSAQFPLNNPDLADLRHPVAGPDGSLIAVAWRTPGKERKLVCLDRGRWREFDGYGTEVLSGWPSLEGGFWILKDGYNLSRVQEGREYPQERSDILAAELRQVAVEPSGAFWITSSHGVARYSPSIWSTPSAVSDIESRVHAIHEDRKGRIWFAAGSLLLMFHEGEWKRYPLPEGLLTTPYFTQSICSMKDGRIVVGVIPYTDCLLTFNPETGIFEKKRYQTERPDQQGERRLIGLIAPGAEGKVLVQTFTRMDTTSFRIEEYDGTAFHTLIDQTTDWEFGNLRYLLIGSNGDLWVAGQTERGGGIFNASGFNFLEAPQEMLDNGLFCMCEVSPGRIWVGGRRSIWEWDGVSWKVLISGLASVRAICRGEDAIWVASGTGVHRYVGDTWVTNTVEDGLPNTASFSILVDSRGRVWTGTIQGLALYNPEADRQAPETFISRQSNPGAVSPDGKVRLIFSAYDQWKQTAPERLLYSYSLDGSEWSPYQPGSAASFENLVYGPHHFEVRAMDVNLNADPTPATFEFRVLLPWYRTRGFQMVAGIGTVFIIVLLGYTLHRHLMLERLVVRRTEDLKQANLKLEDKLADLELAEESLKEEHSRLESILRFKSLLTEIASNLNTTATTGEEIRNVLDLLARRMSLDKVSLYNLDPRNDEVNWPSNLLSTAEKAWTDSNLEMDAPQASLIDAAFRDWCAVFDCDHPGEPGWSEWFASRGIGSACVFPVTTRGVVDGLILYGRNDPACWDQEKVDLLKSANDMIVNAWLRYFNSTAMVEAEKQRADAMQMAERASRLASIGVMAAGITHEINQPLNDIKVTADSVLLWDRKNSGIIPDEFSQWLRSISGSVDRIDGIIRHMRSYWASPSKTEADEFDLNAAVRNALSLIRRQLANHGVKLEIREEEPALRVRGNHIHLEQIVLNLAVNAMYALDKKEWREKRVEVVLGRQGNSSFLEVRDNGIGLPEGAGDKLFDPFFSTRKPGEGMGLGLAIVKRFVQGFGGQVRAWNNETGGATFRVEIPVVQINVTEAV